MLNTTRLLLMAFALSTTGCAMLAIADPIYEVLYDSGPVTQPIVFAAACVPDGSYPSPPPNSAEDPAQYIIQCLCLNWNEQPAAFDSSHWHVFADGQLLAQVQERSYNWCAPEMDTTYRLDVRAISTDIQTIDVQVGPPFFMEWVSGEAPPPECVEWSDPALCFDGPLVVDCP